MKLVDANRFLIYDVIMTTKNAETMNVTIINTDEGASVHKTGCRDIQKYLRQYGRSAQEIWTMDAKSRREVFLDYNSDFIVDGDESGAWPIHFVACAKDLPEQ